MSEKGIELLVTVGVLFIVVLVVIGVRAYSCHVTWYDSGMSSRFKLFGGCQVEVKKGKWIHEKNYREVES